MIRSVRGPAASPRRLRWVLSLVSWISIAGGPWVAQSVHAAPSELLAQAVNDSVPLPPVQPQTRPTTTPATTTPATTNPPTTTPARPTPAKPSRKANSFHLHGGLFAPTDANAPSPTLGVRLGRLFGSHLQGGLLAGWTFERKNLLQPLNDLPGLQPQLVLARVDGHLLPAMGFIQVNFNETRYFVPYAGIAAGYEWLILNANDYRTGETASARFANMAWESWGGIGMRLDPNTRVDFEVFYNGGSLERDVTNSSGQHWSEAVNVNGVGARVGLDILY
jgi:hypothetical protein